MTHDLAALLDGVRSTLAGAGADLDCVCRTVDAALALLPAAAGDRAQADVAALRHDYAATAEHLDGLLAGAGDPAGLRAAGTAWIDAVGAPVSRLVGTASAAVLETDDHWTGAAADAYRAALPAQQIALAAVVAICQEVDAVLEDVAAAILRFWIAVGAACLGLVLALAGALGSAVTAVGVPAAAGMALAGVGALVTAGNAALSDLTDITTAAVSRSAALHRRLTDSTAFPSGAWPRSAALATAQGWEVR